MEEETDRGGEVHWLAVLYIGFGQDVWHERLFRPERKQKVHVFVMWKEVENYQEVLGKFSSLIHHGRDS